MAALKLEDLNGGGHLAVCSVPAGEGREAWVAELSAYERDSRLDAQWLKYRETTGQDDEAGFRAFAVAACWCDPERQFIAKEPKDVASVAAKLQLQGAWVTRAFAKVDELNCITPAALESITKN